MKIVIDKLFKLQDLKYKDFIYKLTPTISKDTIIGVRSPLLKSLGKEIIKDNLIDEFLNDLPHKYYEENMLHSFLISQIKDFNKCINYLDKFVKYIDNWAVNDTIKPKCFIKHKSELIPYIYKWIDMNEEYSIRLGVSLLMGYYLDDDFKAQYMEKVVSIKSDKYYVNMMRAWYFAEALLKKYDYAIKVIENKSLDRWTHNKAIRKAIESYRISDDTKKYLRSLSL